MKTVALVIPVFNESAHIVESLAAILAVCRQLARESRCEPDVLLVDDGSTDGVLAVLKTRFELGRDVHYLRLNANYGKEAAICAGLATMRGYDAVIVMDSDLQHPPALIGQMLALWQQGNSVVSARIFSRCKETAVKRLGRSVFYRLFRLCSGFDLRNESDFKLLDKNAVDFYLALPEQSKYFRGLVHWMNFPTAIVDFEVPVVTKPDSSWTFVKLVKYAIRSVTTFTALPLQIVTAFGVLTFLLSLVIGGKAVYDKMTGTALDGFSTVILLLLIIGSVLMFSLGLIGVYIARIYEEIKGRPAYIIDHGASMVRLDAKS